MLSKPPVSVSVCLLLTATIQVKQDMVFTSRKDTTTRLADYKEALQLWLAHPLIRSIVFVENSGSDLSVLVDLARQMPEKEVEFLSFTAPAFDSSLGKGYGEMLCLAHVLAHSHLLARTPRYLKVTGRYYLANVTALLDFARERPNAAVICDLLLNLTWADSRAFIGTTTFLRRYLLSRMQEVNDSQQVNFEHVLARAVHGWMADGETWAQPPFPLRIHGVSGSQGRSWKMNRKDKAMLHLRYRLFARLLGVGPR